MIQILKFLSTKIITNKETAKIGNFIKSALAKGGNKGHENKRHILCYLQLLLPMNSG